MDRNEFEQDKEIDPGQLDVEAVRQASLFFKWAERSIKAKADVERKKLALDVTEAKLDPLIRSDPEKFGFSKITEKVVAAAIKVHPKYVKAYEEYLQAREISLLLDAAKDTMEQRKRMIEVLVTLHGQQYFAGPHTPRDLPAEYKAYMERMGEEVNDKQIERARTRKRVVRKEV